MLPSSSFGVGKEGPSRTSSKDLSAAPQVTVKYLCTVGIREANTQFWETVSNHCEQVHSDTSQHYYRVISGPGEV